ncbi:MAG TPA: hypothetical protein VID48_12025 [Solirubrobacteraceae bacterium]|jgi:hypothetical protein
MYVRVVRFTDVSVERIEALLARIKESDGPPPGVRATGLTVLSDEAQGTAVILQYFATAADMDAGAEVMAAMDAAETPGVRGSVDMCELKLELDA